LNEIAGISSADDLPVGPKVDATPAHLPEPITIEGRYGRVERLDAVRHGLSLWEAFANHDHIWTYLSDYGPFATYPEFTYWLSSRVKLNDPYSYVVVNHSGRAVGISSLMRIRSDMRVCEVGHIVYSSALQRTPLATEAQYLLARYVFETLSYRRYEWNCNSLNASSRRAALRFGFTFEGIMRQHMIAKGRNRDTAWFAMLDSEWPGAKVAFESWLDPENFDRQGRQRRKLEDIRNSL
jgi:RimJ/RimL family protein N-acetyltransferase